MPKKSTEAMAARRLDILNAAKRCFVRKGFHATTIAEICREAGVSAGGIYTHFANKHAIARAIGEEATQREHDDASLIRAYDDLQTEHGLANARLDVALWAAALRDAELHAMVTDAMNAFRSSLDGRLPSRLDTPGGYAMVEALVLGLEVQRALERPTPNDLRQTLAEWVGGAS